MSVTSFDRADVRAQPKQFASSRLSCRLRSRDAGKQPAETGEGLALPWPRHDKIDHSMSA
jgi:hypothetical protein